MNTPADLPGLKKFFAREFQSAIKSNFPGHLGHETVRLGNVGGGEEYGYIAR